MTRFVIVSRARSGSTMLSSALASHAQVIMHGEVFGGQQFPLNFYGIDGSLPWPTPIELELKRLRDDNPIEFLDRFVFAMTGRAAVGFKFKFEEFALWPMVWPHLIRTSTKIILLTRLDGEARATSEKIALDKGTFNSTDLVTFSSMPSLDLKMLKHGAQIFEHILSYVEMAPLVLRVTYEELTSAWASQIKRVCDFIDVDALLLEPNTKKLTLD